MVSTVPGNLKTDGPYVFQVFGGNDGFEIFKVITSVFPQNDIFRAKKKTSLKPQNGTIRPSKCHLWTQKMTFRGP